MDHIVDHVKAFSNLKDWFSLPDYIICRILINMENVPIIVSSELSSGHGMSRRMQAFNGIMDMIKRTVYTIHVTMSDPEASHCSPSNKEKCFTNNGDRGGTVVKVLCYKSEGRWFDPR